MTVKRATAFVALAVALAGCAGSGNGKPNVPLTSKTRLMQLGDTLIFKLSGTFTPSFGTAEPGTGTATFKIIARNGDDYTYSEKYHFVRQSGKVDDSTGQITLTQGPDAKIWLKSITYTDGTTANVTTGTFYIPGVWTKGWVGKMEDSFDDGTTEQFEMHVNGNAIVDTPVATFNTWACTFKETEGSQVNADGNYYWVPGVSYFCKAQGTIGVGDGMLDGTMTLIYTNIPLPH